MNDNFSFYELEWQSVNLINYTIDNCDYIFKINIINFYESIKENYQEILSEEEIVKSKKFRNINDFKRFVSGRYSLRKILSSFLRIEPQKIIFKLSANNKPYLYGIEFNATHSGDLLIFAVSQNSVGIDLERIDENFDFKSMVDYCFDNQEMNLIENNLDKRASFYWFWTRKEALLKATGEGLIDQMNQLSVIENNIVRLNRNYNLLSFKINDNYLACFASSSIKKIVFFECI